MKNPMILLFILFSFLYSGEVLSQPAVGQVAPTLSGLKMINKGFPNLENKFVFLDFWATWCQPEVMSLPHLNTLALRFKTKVAFLAVCDEKEEEVRSFLQNKQLDDIYFGLDNEQIVHKNFSVKDIPVFYLISPENVVLATGLSYQLMDYQLDSIVNQYYLLKQNNTSKVVVSNVRPKTIKAHSGRYIKMNRR